MILLIDNYDSFSYNLFQLVGSIDPDIQVIRNDVSTPGEIRRLKPSSIIISPGPGRPEDAGICIDVVKELAGEIPILGVCLGHQAICKAFGATVSYAKELMHGKQSLAELDLTSPVFKGLYEKIPVARYHCLKVIAETEDGEVMAVQLREKAVYGLQFHPESILTPDGRVILQNFLNLQK